MSIEALLTNFDRLMQTPESVQRLRRFILDLAVRGKLVPQDPADEPAAELVKRIAAEKARMVKAGEIRPGKVLPTIKIDEAPFRIPAEWCWVRFGNIADFSAGRTPPRNEPSYWNTGDYPWISIADMNDGETLTSTRETVSKESAKRIFRSDPEQVGTMIMSFKLTIGKVAILGIPAYHNEAIISAHPYLTEVDPYLFKALPFFARKSDTKGAIKGATLNRESISNIPIPLPPLAEQRRIVAKVDELMGLCDRLEAARAERETTRTRLAAASLARLNAPDPDQATFREHVAFVLNNLAPLTTRPEQVKVLRQTILNLAVRGKLVEQNPADEPGAELLKRIAAEKAQLARRGRIRQAKPLPSIDPGSLLFVEPLGWTWAHLLEISRKIHYGFTASAIKENNNVVRLLRITDIRNNKVDWNGVPGCEIDEETLPNFKLETGDILIARTGGTIGKSFLVTKLPHVSVFASYLIRVQSSKEICVRYLKLFLESPVYWSQLQTGARGAGQPNINGRTLGKILVSLPPLPEQHRIVTKVNELMALCDRLEGSLEDGDDGRGRLAGALLHDALKPDGSRRELTD